MSKIAEESMDLMPKPPYGEIVKSLQNYGEKIVAEALQLYLSKSLYKGWSEDIFRNMFPNLINKSLESLALPPALTPDILCNAVFQALYEIPPCLKHKKSRNGGDVYIYRPSDHGLHLTIHLPKPEKGYFDFHAHIRTQDKGVDEDVDTYLYMLAVNFPSTLNPLPQLFERYEKFLRDSA